MLESLEKPTSFAKTTTQSNANNGWGVGMAKWAGSARVKDGLARPSLYLKTGQKIHPGSSRGGYAS